MHAQAILMAAVSAGSGPQTASDDFSSYANGSTLSGQGNWLRMSTLGGNWDLGVIKPGSDGRVVGANGSTVNGLLYNAGTWSPDQWSAITTFGGGNPALFALCRCDTSGNGYGMLWTPNFGGLLVLYRIDAGVESTVSGIVGHSVAAGDVVRLEVTGSGSATRLRGILNGVDQFGSVDPGSPYHSSGNPGIGSPNNSGFSGDGITFWQASDI